MDGGDFIAVDRLMGWIVAVNTRSSFGLLLAGGIRFVFVVLVLQVFLGCAFRRVTGGFSQSIYAMLQATAASPSPASCHPYELDEHPLIPSNLPSVIRT